MDKRTIKPYSQYLDVYPKDWRDRACGIVALKMMLDFLGLEAPIIDELIKTGLEMQAYIPGVGWKHQGLLDMAIKFGASGELFDWSKRDPDDALKSLKKILAAGPVICSIHKDFDPQSGGHLVVVSRMEDRTVFYTDPAAEKREDVFRSVPVQTFVDGWKQRGFMIFPKTE